MESLSQLQLPKGIWYEAPKRRFRVRRYRNKVTYLKGYYRTFDRAQAALNELNEELALIPRTNEGDEKALVIPHKHTVCAYRDMPNS